MKTAVTPRRAFLAVLALGWLLLTWASAWGSIVHAARAGEIDFFTFLDSCDQFRRGLSLYTPLRLVPGPDGPHLNHANLNHPIVTLLMLPLDALPREAAFWVWDALGVAAYGAALALAVRALRLRLAPAGWVFLLALAATAPGVLYSLQLGQFGLVLALPVVVVWLLLRDDTETPARVLAAGALTGALLVLKPFLLPLLGLFLARRRWPGLVAAGATGVALSLLALPFVGFGAYREWLAALHSVTWYDHGLNISLAGLLYRVVHPAPPAFVTWLIEGVVTLFGWAVTSRAGTSRAVGQSGSRAARWISATPTDKRDAAENSLPDCPTARLPDFTFGLLLTLSILGSPLGWLYYTPVLIPAVLPLVARWGALAAVPRRLFIAAGVLLWTPYLVALLAPDALWAQLTLRSLPLYGLALLAGTHVAGHRSASRKSVMIDAAFTGRHAALPSETGDL